VIKCSDFVDANEAAVTIEELCQSMRSENSEESGDSDEEGDEEPPHFLALVRQSEVLKLSGDICASTRSVMPD
jgi:hypothetical protein